MKKRLAILFVLCMMFALIPVQAFAATPGDSVSPYASVTINGGLVYDTSEQAYYMLGECFGVEEYKTLVIALYKQMNGDWEFVDSKIACGTQNCHMKENEKKSRILLQLFITFMKIGTFTFGGGYAMIPLIQRETVVKRKWVDDEDILNIVAIAESTPGPIAINTSTFVGYRVGGFWGAVVGTAGMILPSFVIILAISFVLKRFQDIQIVKYAFNGIRAGVLALIIRALWLMYKNVKKSAVTYIVMAAAFVLCAFADVNVIIVIACCALFGLITSYIKTGKEKQNI